MRATWLATVLWMGLWAGGAAAALEWETDFDEAAKSAAAANRYMLLDFTGSDWCGWCIKLDREVFSRDDFQEYAEQNLVCVLLDFPQGKAQRRSLQEQNNRLAQDHRVTGYPTVILLAPDGSTVVRTGYRDGGAKDYVAFLDEAIAAHRKENKVPPPAAATDNRKRGTAPRAAIRPPVKDLPRDTNRVARVWTSKRGESVTASLLQEKGSYVILRRADGKDVQVAKSTLGAEDQQYILSLKTPAEASPPPADAGP